MQEKMKELLDESCSSIKVHTPTLDNNLHPKAELLNMKCPKGKDGVCHSCESFMGFFIKDKDGRMTSSQVYDGYCLPDGVDPSVIKDQLDKLED